MRKKAILSFAMAVIIASSSLTYASDLPLDDNYSEEQIVDASGEDGFVEDGFSDEEYLENDFLEEDSLDEEILEAETESNSDIEENYIDLEEDSDWNELFEEETEAKEDITNEYSDGEIVATESGKILIGDGCDIPYPEVVLDSTAPTTELFSPVGNTTSGYSYIEQCNSDIVVDLYNRMKQSFGNGNLLDKIMVSCTSENSPFKWNATLTSDQKIDTSTNEYKTVFNNYCAYINVALSIFNYEYPEYFWKEFAYGNYKLGVIMDKSSPTGWTGYFSEYGLEPVISFPNATSYIDEFNSAVDYKSKQFFEDADMNNDGTVSNYEYVYRAYDWMKFSTPYYTYIPISEVKDEETQIARDAPDTPAPVFVSALNPLGCSSKGYAKAFMLLCKKAGIPCIIAIDFTYAETETNRNFWNLVCIDNKWYVVDIAKCVLEDTDDYFLCRYKKNRVSNYTTIYDSIKYDSAQLYVGAYSYPSVSSTDFVACANHSWTLTSTKTAATCTKAGVGIYKCSKCGDITEKEIPKTSHTLTKINAKNATCTADGNTAYWKCSKCNKYFSDQNGTKEITLSNTVIKATGHTLTKVNAKAATCTADGNTAYWKCSKCNKYFSDQNGTKEITLSSTVTKATGHTLTKTNAKAATCTADGNTAYWKCSKCNKYFSDQNGTKEITLSDTVVKAKHTLAKINAKAATCTDDGNTTYWKCSKCNKYFSDQNGTKEITFSDTVVKAGHTLTKVSAKEASCTASGNIAYWKCSRCNKYFSDSSGKNEIALSSTVTPAKGHAYGEWKTVKAATYEAEGVMEHSCSKCGNKETKAIAKLVKQEDDNTSQGSGSGTNQGTGTGSGVNSGSGTGSNSGSGSNTGGNSGSNSGQGAGGSNTSSAQNPSQTNPAQGGQQSQGSQQLQDTSGTQQVAPSTEQETTLKVKAKGLKKKKLSIKKGKSVKLKVTSNKKVTYKSKNKKIASVSKTGKIKAKKKGKTTITVKAGNKTFKIKVTVK